MSLMNLRHLMLVSFLPPIQVWRGLHPSCASTWAPTISGAHSYCRSCGRYLFWESVLQVPSRYVPSAVCRSILHRCIVCRSVSSMFLLQWEIRSSGKPITLSDGSVPNLSLLGHSVTLPIAMEFHSSSCPSMPTERASSEPSYSWRTHNGGLHSGIILNWADLRRIQPLRRAGMSSNRP